MSTRERPLVSIIVPVYNVERYLDCCLDSIKKQTYDRLEIIVVEDCSTDGSLKRLQPHLNDERIKLIQHERNGGLSAARNTGIDAANGDYIMFVDSDDVVDHRLVSACVSSAFSTDADLITYGFAPFEDGETITEIGTSSDEWANQVRNLGDQYFQLQHFAWLKFIRADLLRTADIRFPVGLYYEDWPFHWRLGLVARHKVQLAAALYHYRQRATSITGSADRKLLDLFTVQAQVIEIVGAQGSRVLKSALECKLRDNHWTVLTRIESGLLADALDKAQSVDKVMRVNGAPAVSGNWRRYLIKSVVRLPPSLSLLSLKILRNALGKTSFKRRQALASTKS